LGMTTPIIRDARVEDASVLASAEREIAKTPGFLVSRPLELKDEAFAEKIAELSTADNGKYLVAELEGKIAGHAMLDPLKLAAIRHVVHLTIAVHPRWQRKGIGKALLDALIRWARAAAAVEKIELHVRSSNTGTQKMYKSFGFTEVGLWKRRIRVSPDEYLDDVAMELLVK
jgi:ribosomal protein S18 acetylase RimI-like enzyme